MPHVMNLSKESGDQKFLMLKNQVERNDGIVFATFNSKVTMPGFSGDPMEDVITRIWVDGRLMYHGSHYLVVDGQVSPKGASLFMLSEDEDTMKQIGGWDSVRFWLQHSDEMAMFVGDSYGDVLRGCKQVEQELGRGVWVDFFKKYSETFMTAMRGR